MLDPTPIDQMPLKRSPLKAPPLRSPGQSLDEAIHCLISEDIVCYAAAFALATFFMATEWLRWYSNSPPFPVLVTLTVLPLCAYLAFKIRLMKKQLKRLRQARDGEKAVGQYLESFRERGYRVFHDLIENGFNIDHVLIGPAGVFTIETKTISKPARGSCEIEYDGQKVRVNGFNPDRDPIAQAKAEASWVRDFLAESTGMNVRVRPVVPYPGWFITRQPKDAEVWVLNPKSLWKFLEHCPTLLNPQEIRMMAKHISRYQRACEEQK